MSRDTTGHHDSAWEDRCRCHPTNARRECNRRDTPTITVHEFSSELLYLVSHVPSPSASLSGRQSTHSLTCGGHESEQVFVCVCLFGKIICRRHFHNHGVAWLVCRSQGISWFCVLGRERATFVQWCSVRTSIYCFM